MVSALTKCSNYSYLNQCKDSEERSRAKTSQASFRALSGAIESVVTSLVMSREIPRFREFNLSNVDENRQFCLLIKIIERIISIHRNLGHDGMNSYLKQISATFRVIWQKAVIEEEIKDSLIKNCLLFVKLTKPTITEYCRVTLKGNYEYIPTYGICILGYMGKSLPYSSDEKSVEDQFKVFESFKANSIKYDEETKEKVKAWAKVFFKDLVVKGNGKFSISGTIEKPRSKGGFSQLISDYYKCSMYSKEFGQLSHIKDFVNKNPEAYILEPGQFNKVKALAHEFATSVAKDVLKEFLEHASVCKTETCQEFDKHLPMIPVAIKELGAKSRVPCFSSNLLGTLTEPIRESIFKILKKDKRCRFRLEGGKFWLIKDFLKEFKDAEIIHSSDLQVSTDSFSFDFGKIMVSTLMEMGKITKEEEQILLCSLQGFRMIEPNKTNLITRSELFVPDLNEIQLANTTVMPNKPILKKRFGFDPDAYLERWNRKGVFPELFLPDLENGGVLVKEEKLNERNGIKPSPDECLRILHSIHKSILSYQYDEQYITRRGVQMGTSISIAMLYCYNLYCDSQSEKDIRAKGISQICGDDALRAGNSIYIEAYRSELIKTGSTFSPLKDVVGNYPRGVFTEMLISKESILQIPKVKVIVRPEIDSTFAPEWIRAIHSMNNVLGYRVAVRESIVYEIIDKFSNTIKELSTFLPIGLPSKLGGIGDKTRMSERCNYIWSLIKRVKDKLEGLDLLRLFIRGFSIETYPERPIPKISHRLLISLDRPIILNLTKEEIESGYKTGKIQWLYKEIRRLRAGIEACIVLTNPPKIGITKSKINIDQVITENWMTQEKILRRIKKLDLSPTPITDEEFISGTYEAIIPTNWVDSILGTV